MSAGSRWSIVALILLLSVVGLYRQGDTREFSVTTHGTIPVGFGALYELFVELDLTRGRTYVAGDALPAGATVWWLAPRNLCDSDAGSVDASTRSGVLRSLDWIEAGGSALVALPSGRLGCLGSLDLHGLRAPVRDLDVADSQADTDAAPEKAPADSDSDHAESSDFAQVWLHQELTELTLVGDPLAMPRRVELPEPEPFADPGDFEVVVSDDDGRAFVVEARLGAGRLVFVSDASLFENGVLGRQDAAPLAVDLALAYGAPYFDEREHDLRPTAPLLPYLVTSAAAPTLAGATLLALATLWWGRSRLPPTLAESDAEAPTMEVFVESIASLYASTRDYSEVSNAYRDYTVSQIRRAFLLPADTSLAQVCARARSSRGLTDDDLSPLVEETPCSDARELSRRVALLDALVRRVAL